MNLSLCGHSPPFCNLQSDPTMPTPMTTPQWPRLPMSTDDCAQVAGALQPVLVALIDLSLQAKQAHWNVFGTQFLSVHEKLDDVVETARKFGDVVAERIVQLGHSPDGRAKTIASTSPLNDYSDGFHGVPDTLTRTADRLKTVADTVRAAHKAVDETDPPTGDYLNAVSQEIEEHLWMFQAMEKPAPAP